MSKIVVNGVAVPADPEKLIGLALAILWRLHEDSAGAQQFVLIEACDDKALVGGDDAETCALHDIHTIMAGDDSDPTQLLTKALQELWQQAGRAEAAEAMK